MTDQFVTATKMAPPRELIEQWASEKCYDERDWLYEIHIANRAAADQGSYCLDGSDYYVIAKDDILTINAELEGGK